MLTELQRERLYPYGAGIVAGAGVLLIHSHGLNVPYNDNLLVALVTIGGIFSGFMATLNTLLAAMSDDSYAHLKESGYVSELFIYLKEAIWGSLLLCVVPMFGFGGAIKYSTWHAAILFALLFFSFSAIYRITKIGINLLRQRS